MRCSVLLGFAVLLAGCSTTPPPAEVPEAHAELADPLAWSAESCQGRGDYIAADKAWADGQLPSGASSEAYFPRGGELAMLTLECADVLVAGVAQGPDRITIVSIILESVFSPTDPNSIRAHALWAYHAAGDSPLSKLAVAAGIEVRAAELAIESWDGAMTLTAADGSVRVEPLVPRQAETFDSPSETWAFESGDASTGAAWQWSMQPFKTTESSYAYDTKLGGDSFVGACAPLTGGPDAVCRSNTDDHLDVSIVAGTTP